MKILRWIIIVALCLATLFVTLQVLQTVTTTSDNTEEFANIGTTTTTVITNDPNKYKYSDAEYMHLIVIPNGTYDVVYKIINSNYSTKQFCYLYSEESYSTFFNACMQLPDWTISEIIGESQTIVLDLNSDLLTANQEFNYDEIIKDYKSIANLISQYNYNTTIYVVSRKPQQWYNQVFYEFLFYFQQKDNIKLVYDGLY